MIIYLKPELRQLHKPLYILLSGYYQCRGILSFLGEQELMKNQRTERRHYKIFCVNVIGCFTVYKSSKDYPEKLRKLIIESLEDGTRYIFLTNNLDASAELVSSLYRNRWSVELFFYEKHIIMQSCRQSRIDIQQNIHTTSRFNFA